MSDVPEISEPAASASSPVEIGPALRNTSNQASDVIVIDSDTSPIAPRTRAPTRGRKSRRLNDSSSVIVLDDENSPARRPSQPDEIRQGPVLRPRAAARRTSARAGSSSSARPASRDPPPLARLGGRTRHFGALNLTGGDAPVGLQAPGITASMANMPSLAIPRFHTGPISTSSGASIARLAIFRVSSGLTSGAAGAGSAGRGSSARRGRGLSSLAPRRWEFALFTNDLPDYETLIGLDDQLTRERNAAPKSVIDSLPEIVATEADEELSCVVCMCDIEKGDKLRVLPCTHKYHKKCIDRMYHCTLLPPRAFPFEKLTLIVICRVAHLQCLLSRRQASHLRLPARKQTTVRLDTSRGPSFFFYFITEFGLAFPLKMRLFTILKLASESKGGRGTLRFRQCHIYSGIHPSYNP